MYTQHVSVTAIRSIALKIETETAKLHTSPTIIWSKWQIYYYYYYYCYHHHYITIHFRNNDSHEK